MTLMTLLTLTHIGATVLAWSSQDPLSTMSSRLANAACLVTCIAIAPLALITHITRTLTNTIQSNKILTAACMGIIYTTHLWANLLSPHTTPLVLVITYDVWQIATPYILGCTLTGVVLGTPTLAYSYGSSLWRHKKWRATVILIMALACFAALSSPHTHERNNPSTHKPHPPLTFLHLTLRSETHERIQPFNPCEHRRSQTTHTHSPLKLTLAYKET